MSPRRAESWVPDEGDATAEHITGAHGQRLVLAFIPEPSLADLPQNTGHHKYRHEGASRHPKAWELPEGTACDWVIAPAPADYAVSTL